MLIRVVTKEVRYIYEIFLTLEHSISISSLAVLGLTPIALQLHVLVLPKPYDDLLDTNFTHMCLVVALSFIKLCDPSEMYFILV